MVARVPGKDSSLQSRLINNRRLIFDRRECCRVRRSKIVFRNFEDTRARCFVASQDRLLVLVPGYGKAGFAPRFARQA